MDDFSISGTSFDDCSSNLDRVLQRCEETYLVLNWRSATLWLMKVLSWGINFFERGIEVGKSKVDAIEKMQCPKEIKRIRSFLGHTSFYRRFIKDFSKISRPLTNLLQKDIPFVFDDDCV